MELQEAAQIHTGLQPPNVGRSTSLHDMKAIVKTWRLETFIITSIQAEFGSVCCGNLLCELR